jgi:hypothetical protein
VIQAFLLILLLWAQVAHAVVAGSGLTQGTDAACTGTSTTASFTPTANALILACVVNEIASGTAPTISSITGNGLTWVLVGTAITPSGLNRTTLYRASSASTSTGTATITFSGAADDCVWQISEYTGQDTSGTNGSGAIVQSAVNNGGGGLTSLTVTLAAFASSSNAAVGCFGSSTNNVLTPGAGFTEIGTQPSSSTRAITELDGEDTTVNVTSASTALQGVAAEIKVAPLTTRRKRRPIVFE